MCLLSLKANAFPQIGNFLATENTNFNFFFTYFSDNNAKDSSPFQCMPELELETVFEAGTSLDPSNSVEYEVCENGATTSASSSSIVQQSINTTTTTNRLSSPTKVTSTKTLAAAVASSRRPLLEPPTLAEAKKSMKVRTNAMANSDVTFSAMV